MGADASVDVQLLRSSGILHLSCYANLIRNPSSEICLRSFSVYRAKAARSREPPLCRVHWESKCRLRTPAHSGEPQTKIRRHNGRDRIIEGSCLPTYHCVERSENNRTKLFRTCLPKTLSANRAKKVLITMISTPVRQRQKAIVADRRAYRVRLNGADHQWREDPPKEVVG